MWFYMGMKLGSDNLREENKFRVFGNRVLRGLYGNMREEVTGGLRK
jgi:hypothetical protein